MSQNHLIAEFNGSSKIKVCCKIPIALLVKDKNTGSQTGDTANQNLLTPVSGLAVVVAQCTDIRMRNE